MTLDDALAEAIARTGVHRYRFLCLEHPDPKVRADYSRLVTEIAAGTYTGQRFKLYEGSTTDMPDNLRPCGGCPGSGY